MPLKKLVISAFLKTSLPETFFRRKSKGRITVFAYHRIMPLPDSLYPYDGELVSATPEEFERELRYYQRHTDLLTVAELLDGLKNPASLPERPALITFDDGYADNHDVAYPILRHLGLSACFFLSTHLVGTDNIPWWDVIACCFKHPRADSLPSPFGEGDSDYSLRTPSEREAATRRFVRNVKATPWSRVPGILATLQEKTGVDPKAYAEKPLFMSWEDAREMAAGGMELGGHTRSHPVVSRITDRETLREEIGGCAEDLTRETGRAPLAFAYPVGSPAAMSPAAEVEIADAGFKLWFSYIHSLGTPLGDAVSPLPRLHTEYLNDFGCFRLGLARSPVG